MKTVAAISFNSNHSLSMDVESVNLIETGRPTQIDENLWTCEILIRSANGTVALNLLAESAEKLRFPIPPETEE